MELKNLMKPKTVFDIDDRDLRRVVNGRRWDLAIVVGIVGPELAIPQAERLAAAVELLARRQEEKCS